MSAAQRVQDESKVFLGVVDNLQRSNVLPPDEKNIWAGELSSLVEMYTEFATFVDEFDYSSDLKFNGFRSFMKMVLAHFAKLSKTVKSVTEKTHNSKREEKLKILQAHTFVLFLTGKSMKKCKLLLNQLQNGQLNEEQFFSTALENKIEAVQKFEEKKPLGYFNPCHFYPWMPKWCRLIYYVAQVGMYYFSKPIYKSPAVFSVKCVLKHNFKFVSKATAKKEMAKINKLNNNWLLKSTVRTSNVLFFRTKVSRLKLKSRQRDWIIDEKSGSITNFSENNNTNNNSNIKNTSNAQKAIKCVLMEPRNNRSKDLIVFVHGGGFVILSTNSYIYAIRPIVEFTGTPVLSIDYTLSPEVKYPMSLQEVLDVYLNVLSSESIINYKPENIVLMGDSAGGYMVTALAIAIAEIREMQMSTREQLVPLPKSIVVIYPLTSCCIGHFTPSRTFNDFLIFQKMYFLMYNAYAGPIDEEAFEKVNGSIWHMEKNVLLEVGSQVNSRKEDPLFNPVGYKHFDRLKDVPLYIQVGEFDPLLDGSINLAKLWQGHVTLDVIPNVSHGWISFEPFAPKSFKGCKILRQRVKEALGQMNNSAANNNNLTK